MPDPSDLEQILRNASRERLRAFAPALQEAMQRFAVAANLQRAAAFIAQLAHESGEFRLMQEIWGPTPAQKRYEPQSDLARRLGNTQPGDGKRFKGRGPIQVTGRANYQRYGDPLGVDLVGDPALAATPELGFAIAGLYWKRNGLNALADRGDVRGDHAAHQRRPERPGAAARSTTSVRSRRCWPPAIRRAAAAQPARAAPAWEPLAAAPSSAGRRQAADPASPRRWPGASSTPAPTPRLSRPMYVPTLVEVPTHIPLGDYLDYEVPILDQGSEGACTGFGLATVANYLLRAARRARPGAGQPAHALPHGAPLRRVAGRGLLRLQRPRRDEGLAQARRLLGAEVDDRAAKGDSSGLTVDARRRRRPPAARRLLPRQPQGPGRDALGHRRGRHALRHRLGARRLGRGGRRRRHPPARAHPRRPRLRHRGLRRRRLLDPELLGPGLGPARLRPHQLRRLAGNGTDVWVARLGAPVVLRTAEVGGASAHASTPAQSASLCATPTCARTSSASATTAGSSPAATTARHGRGSRADLRARTSRASPRAGRSRASCSTRTAAWSARRRGAAPGRLPADPAARRRSIRWPSSGTRTTGPPRATSCRTRCAGAGPKACSTRPRTSCSTASTTRSSRWRARSPARRLGRDEGERAGRQSGDGAAALVAEPPASGWRRNPGWRSTSRVTAPASIFYAPLVSGLLTEPQLKIETCTLWAPACTVDLFQQHYRPAIEGKDIRKFALFAAETTRPSRTTTAPRSTTSRCSTWSRTPSRRNARIPIFRDGEPILGMETLPDEEGAGAVQRHRAPVGGGAEPVGSPPPAPPRRRARTAPSTTTRPRWPRPSCACWVR